MKSSRGLWVIGAIVACGLLVWAAHGEGRREGARDMRTCVEGSYEWSSKDDREKAWADAIPLTDTKRLDAALARRGNTPAYSRNALQSCYRNVVAGGRYTD